MTANVERRADAEKKAGPESSPVPEKRPPWKRKTGPDNCICLGHMLERNGFMIVIGASAGGLNAIGELLSFLSPDINAAIGIVIHTPSQGSNAWVVPRLQKHTSLPCRLATDRLPLEKGVIYLAPANYHLLVKEDKLLLGRGPMEGRWRPSIDTGFRSAAASWDSHCIGIILTGLLDDGTSGMAAIKNCGGLCIVQDPAEAEYPDMPLSVLRNIEPDHCVPLSGMVSILEERTSSRIEHTAVPDAIQKEAALSEQAAASIGALAEMATHSVYTCPDCGGGLWQMKNGSLCHYRCHIGHTYTEWELMAGQLRGIENTLWVALRMMEERRNLLTNLSEKEKDRGQRDLSGSHDERAGEMTQHIERLKEVLFDQQKQNTG
jgi:two-component system chemotaxis response regulator CheB